MFPTLEPVEIERVRRFGEVRSYRAGEALAARLEHPEQDVSAVTSSGAPKMVLKLSCQTLDELQAWDLNTRWFRRPARCWFSSFVKAERK
jgi:hypothetical protein